MSEPLDEIVTRLEQEVSSLPEKQNQVLQHLVELGYLPLLQLNAINDKDVEAAKVTFLKEAITSDLYAMSAFQLIGEEQENDLLARLLQDATDIDEGFVFDTLPSQGETSLRSRIVHYRLDIFGLWPFPIDRPFDMVNSVAQLKVLSSFLGLDSISALNQMADVEKMTAHLLNTHPEEDFILAFRPANPINGKLKSKLERTGKFKRQLVRDFGERTEFFKYLRKEVLKDNPEKVDFAFLNQEIRKPFKKFILRLIQVHQWKEGMYEGLLDSDMGALTIESILKTNELHNEIQKTEKPAFRILTHVANDYYLFNALYFLQEYMLEDNVENAEEQIVSDLLHDVRSASDQDLKAFELHMNVMKAEIALASRQQPVERKGFLQRIYYGIKKFFKKIVKFSKKIFRWVVSFYEKFKGLLKKVFGNLFEKLSAGIRAFMTGLQFLLGNSETITMDGPNLMASVIRIDGDCYNIIAGRPANEAVIKHQEMITYKVRSLHFALAVVGGVLSIVVRSLSVISWPFLLMTIINTIKEISKSYQELNIITN